MTAKKFFYVCIGFVAVLSVLLIASLYFMKVFLQQGSNKLVEAKLESRVSEEREKYYLQAKKDLEKYKDVSETLAKVLPKNKDQAIAVAEIGRIADETGIEIKQISFPSSTLGEKKAAAAGSTASNTSAKTGTSTTTVTQAKPVDGVSGVLGIETQIQFISSKNSKLTYAQIISFLQKIEKNRRTMQVSSISITPKEDGQIDAAISVKIFVKP